jgi:trimeric autotransporter adhesin
MGIATIAYTVTGICGSSTATFPITVDNSPTAGTLSGDSLLCVSVTGTITASVPGGSWSATNSAIASVSSSGVIHAVSAGTDSVVYTLITACGSATAYHSVTVSTVPATPAVSGAVSLCEASTATLTGSPSGGNWSSAATGIATVNPIGIVSGVSAGTSLISYSVSNSCGSSYTTYLITVNPLPDAGSISGPSSLCVSTAILIYESVTGGTWSTTNGNATVYSGGLVGNTAGSDTVVYTVTNSCGNATATYPVTVEQLPVTGPIQGDSIACPGTVISLTDTVSGGAWSASPTGIVTVDVSGNATALSAGTGTITYMVTGLCGTVTTLHGVTVNPAPAAGTIAGNGQICPGIPDTLTETIDGGVWTSSSPTSVSITSGGVATMLTTGTATISYTYTNSCGSVYTTFPVTLNSLPSPGTISGAAAVCQSSLSTLSDGAVPGAWTSADPLIASVATDGTLNALSAGITTISYTVNNVCGSAFTTFVVTVNALASAGSVSGSTTVCTGLNDTLTTSVSGGIWTSGNPAIADVNSSGIVTGNAPGVSVLTYSVSNICNSATTQVTISVGTGPTINPIAGDSQVCQGSMLPLTETTPIASWSSSSPIVAAVSLSGVVTGIATGTATITCTAYNSCGSIAVTHNITVNPVPSAITGSNSVCLGATITLADTSAGGSWSSGNITAIGIDPSTGIASATGTGVSTIAYTYPTTGCSALKVVSVSPMPSSGIITGPSTLCAGSFITLSDIISGGVWSASNPDVSVSMSGVVSGTAAGTDTVKYTVTNGCGAATARYTLTVQPLPTPPTITGPTGLCQGNSGGFTSSDTSGIWTVTNSNGILIGGTFTAVVPGYDTLVYTLSNACGASADTQIVAIYTLPGTISGTGSLCQGSSTLLTCTSSGNWFAQDTTIAAVNATSGICTGTGMGTTVITFTSAEGCISTGNVTVNAAPAAISGLSNICAGNTSTYTDSTTGAWTATGITLTIDATGVVTTTTAGIDTLIFTAAGGCFVTKTVTVNPVAANITGTTGICRGNSETMSDASTGGMWSVANGLATIDGPSGFVVGNMAGTDTISYTLPTGCFTTFLLTINEIPAPISGLSEVCTGMHDTLTSTESGVWVVTNTNGSIDSTSGIFTGTVPGTDTVVYTLPGDCSTYTTIVINTIPTVAVLTGPDTICTGSSVTLNDSTSGGIWSTYGTGISIASGLVTGIATGLDTVAYTITNLCGAAIASKTIQVSTLPAISPISGGNQVCVGTTITLSDATSSGVWTVSNNFLTTISPDGVLTGLMAGSDTVHYTINGFCGSHDTFIVVSVDTLQHSHVNGGNFVCPGHTDTLYAFPSGGTWSLTNASLMLTGNVVTGLIAGIDTVTYNYEGTCGISSFVFPIVVPVKSVCDSIDEVHTVLESNESLSVYPNPTQGAIHVSWNTPFNTDATLRISNLNGQQVLERTIRSNTDVLLDSHLLGAGVYFITITAPGESLVRKLVVLE